MAVRSRTLSYARGVVTVTSLIGLALITILGFAGRTADVFARFLTMLVLALPYIAALVSQFLPLSIKSRVVLLWLCVAGAGIVAAITIFSGIGFFFLAIALTYLWAAWIENRDAV